VEASTFDVGEVMRSQSSPRLSVVIATFNRRPILERLLRDLARQTVPPPSFEVVVVDDGSREPVRAACEALPLPYALRVIDQANAGAAAARQRGAEGARAELVLFLDDDMEVSDALLEAHLGAHADGARRAVLGPLRRPESHGRAPLFRRWHQTRLEQFYGAVRAGRVALRGWNLYSANLSLRRADLLAVGGFDARLSRSEDAELGMRLEHAGVAIALCDAAWAVNASDHTSVAAWRRDTEVYGATDVRIARKHGDRADASPWRYLASVNPLVPPVMVGAALVPPLSRALGAAAYAAGAALDRVGLEGPAMTGATLAYAIDYLRGVRTELGSGRALLADLARFVSSRGRGAAAGGER
jgi:glycosyltransferase involved in cell wall biosynthesis